MRAGGDVEKNHFVGALIVIAEREFHRVAHAAELARLGFAKLDAACYFSVVDIKARDDTFCNHATIKSRFGMQGKSFRTGDLIDDCGLWPGDARLTPQLKHFLNRRKLPAVWTIDGND
jgi:hypothetical protein